MGYRQSGGIDASLVMGNGIRASLRSMFYRSVYSPGYLVGIDMPVELSSRAIEGILVRSKPGEFVTGHVGYTAELLKRIKSMGYAPLLVIRHPYAVLNSFVHYVDDNRNHPLHDFYQDKTEEKKYRYSLYSFSHGQLTLRPLLERCQSLDSWKSDKDVLVLRFEELVGPSGGGSRASQAKFLADMVEFLDIQNIQIANVADKVFDPVVILSVRGDTRLDRRDAARYSARGWLGLAPCAGELVL